MDEIMMWRRFCRSNRFNEPHQALSWIGDVPRKLRKIQSTCYSGVRGIKFPRATILENYRSFVSGPEKEKPL